jgi:hypothetical protein
VYNLYDKSDMPKTSKSFCQCPKNILNMVNAKIIAILAECSGCFHRIWNIPKRPVILRNLIQTSLVGVPGVLGLSVSSCVWGSFDFKKQQF